MSTPKFIPRRERDAARRQPTDGNIDAEIGSCLQYDVSRTAIPPYLAIGHEDGSDRSAAHFGVRVAADLVALSTLVAMRPPLEVR